MKYNKKLYDLEEKTSLGANAIVLFFFLQEIKNAEEKVIISDYDLSKILRMARQTIYIAKRTLKEHGLIDFHSEKGKITTYTFPNELVQEKAKQLFQENSVQKEKVVQNESILSVSEMENTGYPTLQEFMEFAQSLEKYTPNLDTALKSKYETWDKNGWISGLNTPIKNWKQTLKNVMPFLSINSTNEPKNIISLPKIIRPKTIRNE